jgi:hypothetical protein
MRSPLYAWDDGEWVHLWVREGTGDVFLDPDPEQIDDGDWPGFVGGIRVRGAVFDRLVAAVNKARSIS